MLNLNRLRRIELSARPFTHSLIGHVLLTPNYRLANVELVVEGEHHLPSTPSFLAMNHTDRYNYWPFQYVLWRDYRQYTATWVKGKYYEHPLLAKYMEWTNNIPAVSRGYLIAKDFLATVQRRPSETEYSLLRKAVDTAFATGDSQKECDALSGKVPDRIRSQKRNLFGLDFDPSIQNYVDALLSVYRDLMTRFVELNQQALDRGLHVLVFPQGTRSVRLSRGHSGLAQVALHTGASIVPVGCNGSEVVYPSSSPVARRGRIVFRIGEPLHATELAELGPREPFQPFSPEAEARHRPQLQAVTDVIMDRINGLLDPPYQFANHRESDGVRGTERFL